MNDMRASMPNSQPSVLVEAPGRLHLGFIDIDGHLGRRFGSLGLTLDGLSTQVRAHFSGAGHEAAGPEANRALKHLNTLAAAWGIRQGIRLDILDALPAHAGLGSGTQLALAVGTAVARLTGRRATTADIARALARGARSGIGIGGFDVGGFLMDGGRKGADAIPLVTARLDVPDTWRIVLVLDHGDRGLHGDKEVAAFAALPPFSRQSSAHLAHLVLMQVLPALAEGDMEAFGHGVAELQRVTGDHFAPSQGGRFASPRVARALAWLAGQGVACVGQSSWGPTGFGIVGSARHAATLAAGLAAELAQLNGLEIRVLHPRNHGARIQVEAAAESAMDGSAYRPPMSFATAN